jgi:hypothetical protein
MRKKILLFFCFFLISASSARARERFWDIESIDTMKLSRDEARSSTVSGQIPFLVGQIAALKPTHIALDTPYDEEFYPVLKLWVSAARANHLKVWFRGNFSGWEGWFGYVRFANPAIHHSLTKQFIISHPDLFEEGDIFTPTPEPENGGYGDPRKSSTAKQNFLQFLKDSYQNCVESFKSIGKEVSCGYFSTNGDIAKYVLDTETIAATGNRIVIDHYVKTSTQLVADIQFLQQKFGVPIVLGEFGAPIPDLQGDLSDVQQNDFIADVLAKLSQVSPPLEGVNYWTAFGGSTSLFNPDFSKKAVADTIARYFAPYHIYGRITGLRGSAVKDAQVTVGDKSTTSDTDGAFSILTVEKPTQIVVTNQLYETYTHTVADTLSQKLSIKLHFSLRHWLESFLKSERHTFLDKL